jgi:F0F1-type ATP synthase assembly protein I
MGVWSSRSTAAFQLIGVGFYIATCIVIGVAVGLFLDERLGTGPILLMLCLFLGLAVAFYGTYRMVKLVSDEEFGQQDEENL